MSETTLHESVTELGDKIDQFGLVVEHRVSEAYAAGRASKQAEIVADIEALHEETAPPSIMRSCGSLAALEAQSADKIFESILTRIERTPE